MTNPIVKAYKWLDEDVLLRQATKVAKRWEDKGRNIYHLSSAIGATSVGFLLQSTDLISYLKDTSIYSVLCGTAISHGQDVAHNIWGWKGEIEETTDSNSRAINPGQIILEKIGRISRVPYFLFGIGSLGKVAYDTYNYFANGESIPNEDFGLASLGLSNLGLSFSMYLKDRDPKLLDKQPAWRRKFESAKKKTGELSDRLRDWVPQPQPELAPIPIRYATQTKELEDYVR